jgi:hypothetical protein
MAFEGFAILKKHGLVYLAGEERTGKLLTSILIAEQCAGVKNVLVLTTKQALKGWNEALVQYETNLRIHATNYHQAKSVSGGYDLVILDECHNYMSAYPKQSAMWDIVKKLCYQVPIIYSSATPHAQGRQQLYGQLALSSYSPWKQYKNFFKWFNHYGIPEMIMIRGQQVNQYNKVDDAMVRKSVDHLFVSTTRQEQGFEHEPSDVIHWVELDEATKNTYNALIDDKYYQFLDGDEIIADTVASLKANLHQIESGGCKIQRLDKKNCTVISDPKVLSNKEKVDYIKKTWGDKDNMIIMYQYHSEGAKLHGSFKKAQILQGTTFAEGVDLSHYKHLIIYSMDFRTSKYSQRRARQANRAREEKIDVHYLLVKGAISEQVYTTVAVNKKNFIDSVFKKEKL